MKRRDETAGCKQWTLKLSFADHHQLIPLRCKSWRCPECAPINRRRLNRRLADTRPTHLITLTCRPASFSCPYEAFRHLSAALPNLVKRLKRQFPALDLQYLLVWERGKSGWPHIHLVARTSFLPQRVLSRHWRELTGAPVVDIRRISDHRGAVHYVAKYLTKGPGCPSPMHAFRTSRGFWATPGGLFGRPSGPRLPWQLLEQALWRVLFDYPPLLYRHVPLPPDSFLVVPRAPPASAGQELPARRPPPLRLAPFPSPRGGAVRKGAWGGGGALESARIPQ